jgi:hypothetical protein
METPTGGEAAIYTDSKVTIDSLKNHTKHGYLIETIRNMIRHSRKTGLYTLDG